MKPSLLLLPALALTTALAAAQVDRVLKFATDANVQGNLRNGPVNYTGVGGTAIKASVNTVNITAPKAVLDAWLAPLKDVGGRRNIIEKIGNTDHLSFTALGLPGFNTIQDYTEYDTRMHHTNMDFYERVKTDELKQAAVVLASFAYQAAMRPEKFPRASAVP